MADKVEITVVVDNSIDIFLPSSDVARFPGPGKTAQLWAEQGLSLWIEVFEGVKSSRILYDFGRSDQVLSHNAKLLGLDLKELDFLVLSHGHVDHYGSLLKVLGKTDGKCKLIVHPEATRRTRSVRLKDGTFAGPWRVKKSVVEEFGPRICAVAGPSDLGLGVFVSGEIEKKTSFEHGMPNAFMKVQNEWVCDGIEDDQSLLIRLENKGLIVITGCCHAGLVNTLLAARKKFPGEKIHAVIGGFHLNAAEEAQMGETLDYLSKLKIKHICSMHCTGHYAQKTLMDKFAKQWIPATVGAKITL
jgi:7,8-dihydropterin-6-yl-methyl-4-(beta-D-ribofuranosyl)aminobenzene 5'-phosphate synthase